MPTYEYHCDSCEKNFDVVQSFQDDPLTACPTCGSPVRKVFGNVGIVFKGSGFYKNDSRPGTATKGAGAESPSEGKAPADGSAADGKTAAGSTSSGEGTSPPSTTESTSDSAKPKPVTPAKSPAKDSTS